MERLLYFFKLPMWNFLYPSVYLLKGNSEAIPTYLSLLNEFFKFITIRFLFSIQPCWIFFVLKFFQQFLLNFFRFENISTVFVEFFSFWIFFNRFSTQTFSSFEFSFSENRVAVKLNLRRRFCWLFSAYLWVKRSGSYNVKGIIWYLSKNPSNKKVQNRPRLQSHFG